MSKEDTKQNPQEKLRDMYRAVFNGANGRLVLHDMMVNAGMFRSSFQDKDPHGTSYMEGRRSVIIDIINITAKDNTEFLDKSADLQEDFNKTFID